MFLGNDKGRIMSKVAMPLTNCRFANIVSGPTMTKLENNENWIISASQGKPESR